MAFDARCFWHAKDLASVADYEDAFDVDPNVGRAAIADGVSTAIFSRRWAQLLTSSSVATPPAWDDDASVNAWILEQRKAWAKSINIHALPWMQKAKLEQSGGAYAAFLWAEIQPLGSVPLHDTVIDGSAERDLSGSSSVAVSAAASGGGLSGFRCRSVAVGDCCLFHVREGELLARFPLTSEADFARDPLTFCSSSRNRQPNPPLQRCEFDCQAGDWIVLSSDALAKWLYRLSDHGQPIDWVGLWRQDAYAWTHRVGELRLLDASERVRVDDSTLVILRVGHSPVSTVIEASESAVPTAFIDEPSPFLLNAAVEIVAANDDVVVAELVETEDIPSDDAAMSAAENVDVNVGETNEREAVITETAISETTISEMSTSVVAESPATESPITELLVAESPATESPHAESLVAESPVAESPVADSPVAESLATESLVAESPVAESPRTESTPSDALG